ncbi:hypothetical protein [Desulfobaculum senezii]
MSEVKKKKQKTEKQTAQAVVDMQGLALALGLSLPTVRARVREGMPCVQEGGRGKAWKFDLAECVAWHTERAVSKAVGDVEDGISKGELERLLLVEELKIKRVSAARELGEVAPIEEMERVIASAFVEVRQAMLALPDRLALRVMAATDETAVKEILREEIDLALSSLAETDLLEKIEDAAD